MTLAALLSLPPGGPSYQASQRHDFRAAAASLPHGAEGTGEARGLGLEGGRGERIHSPSLGSGKLLTMGDV